MTDKSHSIDSLVLDSVFGKDDRQKEQARQEISRLAASLGIRPNSIQNLYEAAGNGLYSGLTVPAINIRGICYHVARAVFKAALARDVGALVFEIARSEIGYTLQPPSEYVTCILAAAIREDFKGPVFIQGDHFQVRRKMFREDRDGEISDIKQLIKDAVDAGFYNIDIDASTLVDLEKQTLEEQQELNCQITADLTRFIRGIEPEGATISIGGEIGEVGKINSTVEDLRVFMAGYSERIENEMLPHQAGRFRKQIEFILEADKLKHTLRRTILMNKSRRENSAEHSWHIALTVLVLSEYAQDKAIDVLRVVVALSAARAPATGSPPTWGATPSERILTGPIRSGPACWT